MKVFFTGCWFALHRPCGFGKAFTSILVEAFYRGGEIVSTSTSSTWGSATTW